MKRCPVCGAGYSPEIAYCAADGTKLADTQEIPTGSDLRGLAQPVPSAAQRVPTFVWVLVGLAAVFFLIIPILMLIAIPTMANTKRYANETSAIHSIMAINLAEAQYQVTYPQIGYACSLAALGGDSNSGPPTPAHAQMLVQDLASGVKSGYRFTIGNCAELSVKGVKRITTYAIVAQPLTVGKTGNRTFCSDQFGAIKFDPTGGTNCTQNLNQ
jgi:type IV pilus assembly protein PilA